MHEAGAGVECYALPFLQPMQPTVGPKLRRPFQHEREDFQIVHGEWRIGAHSRRNAQMRDTKMIDASRRRQLGSEAEIFVCVRRRGRRLDFAPVLDEGGFGRLLHVRFGKGSRASLSWKPKSFHAFCICGGSGAVTRNRPPSGCAMSMERACRCSRFSISPAGCASAPPYLKSPTMGIPRLTRWTRIWCVRPVTGLAATKAYSVPARSITT